jgi:hypothetical protein
LWSLNKKAFWFIKSMAHIFPWFCVSQLGGSEHILIKNDLTDNPGATGLMESCSQGIQDSLKKSSCDLIPLRSGKEPGKSGSLWKLAHYAPEWVTPPCLEAPNENTHTNHGGSMCG